MTVEPSEIFAFMTQGLPERLTRLPRRERAAFAAACASRLLRQHPPRRAALTRKAIVAAWQVLDGENDQARTLLDQLARLGDDDLDEDPTAAGYYALRAALNGDAKDAAWAADRCFEAAFGIAESEVVTGWAVTRADLDTEASTAIVQGEFQRQIQDLALLEEHGLTENVRSTLQGREQ